MRRTKRTVTRIVTVEYKPIEPPILKLDPPYKKVNQGDGEGLFILGLFGALMGIRKVARNREAKRLRALRRKRDGERK